MGQKVRATLDEVRIIKVVLEGIKEVSIRRLVIQELSTISEPVQGIAIHVHLHRGMEAKRILRHELLPIHSHGLHQGATHAAQHDAHQTLRGGGESERGKGDGRRATGTATKQATAREEGSNARGKKALRRRPWR